MQSYRDFRKEILQMCARDLSALLGCGHTDVSRVERRSEHNAYTKAMYLLFQDDPKRAIRIFLLNTPKEKKPITVETFAILDKIAKKYLVQHEYHGWKADMVENHPELAPKTP